MKTFRFTVPEPPLSEVEKMSHKMRRGKGREVSDYYLTPEGTVTGEGIEFVKWCREKNIKESNSFFWIFLKQKAVEALYVTGGYGALMSLFVFSSSDKGALILRVLTNLSLIFPVMIAVSMIWFRSSRKMYLETLERLEQAIKTNGEQIAEANSQGKSGE